LPQFSPQHDRSVRFGLLVAFFLSGAAALIYQVLWTRQLSLVFGVTVYAATTVLACFMAGLALGSYAAGRLSDRIDRPVHIFALAEFFIGITALITPMALSGVERVYVALGPLLGDSQVLKALARAGLSSCVLIVPAALMGSTYPLLLRAASRTSARLASSAALLYGTNTAGAIVGVLLASLWLLPTLGIQRTYFAAVAINTVVAALAWGLSLTATPGEVPSVARSSRGLAPVSPTVRRWVLIVMVTSGALSLALEIIWFRILVFFLRPTTYAFASMLAAVLLGIAAGSLIATPALRRRANWVLALGVLEVLVAIASVLSLRGIVAAYYVLDWLWDPRWLPPPYNYVLPLLGAAASAILPTALLLGAAFPIGLVLWSEIGDDDDHLGRRIGTLYAGNVAGAILGSLAAGFVLVPTLGARTSLLVVAVLPLVGGLVLLWLSGSRSRLIAIAVGVAAFAGCAVTVPDAFRQVVGLRYAGQEMVWQREDAQTSVIVIGTGHHTLLIDGISHASEDGGSLVTHRAIGLLGLAVHPTPRRVLVIGLGGGTTAGAASSLPGSKTTVVELSPSVLAANRFFAGSNLGVLTNPDVTFHIDDGRNFLLLTPRRFDVVTADLIMPHLAGAGNLYSLDYFKLVKKALAPGGLMVQWLATDSEYQYKIMLRTFAAAFPNVTLWAGGSLAVGSLEPLRITRADFEEKLTRPRVRALLEGNGIGTVEGLRDAYFAGPKEIARYVGEGPLLTDDLPVIEYFLSIRQGGAVPDLSAMHGNAPDVFGVDPHSAADGGSGQASGTLPR
jgi:spermidine synthase